MLLKSADHGYREITINKFSEGKDEDLQYPRLDQGVQDVQDTVVNRISVNGIYVHSPFNNGHVL